MKRCVLNPLIIRCILTFFSKGIQLGVGDKIKALVDRDQKVVQKIESGNRDLVTIIECISATGVALHPSVIFQGQRRDLRWGEDNPCEARSALIRLMYSTQLTCYLASPFRRMAGQTKSWGRCGSRRTSHRRLRYSSTTPVTTVYWCWTGITATAPTTSWISHR